MSQYMVNLASGIWPFERVWVLFLLISSLVACAATTKLSDPATQLPRILVLDNCDSNYKFPPFNDEALLLNSKSEIITSITGLNVCQNIGGNRAISVSDDGRFFVVCENVANKITACDLMTRNKIWSFSGRFTSAAIAWVTGKCGLYKMNLSFRKWPPSWQRTYRYIGPRTHKYSSGGKLLLEIKRGGHSIDIDRSDGSIWIAD